MDKSKNYENSIPQDYVLVKYVDAKNDKKQITIYTLLSFVPLLIILPVLILIARYCNSYDISDSFQDYSDSIALLVTGGVLLIYVVLHELVHGVTYKILQALN